MISPPPANGWPVLAGSPISDVQQDANARTITATDQSIDQLLLQNVPALRGPRIPSLQLAANPASSIGLSGFRVISYERSPLAPFSASLRPEANPSVVAQRLSGALVGVVDPSAAVDQRVLEYLKADLQQLRPRLPASQVHKVDSYLSSLPVLEKSLGECALPALPPLPDASGVVGRAEAQYLEICRQQFQLIKTAFQCDLTRVISFTFGNANSALDVSKILPPGSGIMGGENYVIAHTVAASASLQAIDTFYSQQTAQLLLALKNTPEGAGSVLDNTLVVYYNNEAESLGHTTKDMPILLFGGKFLKVNGGQYLQFTNRYMSDLWVQTAKAWGYSALSSYGASRWNQGPMPGIYG